LTNALTEATAQAHEEGNFAGQSAAYTSARQARSLRPTKAVEAGEGVAPPESGQGYRQNHALDPLWNMLDLTPEGRGDFHPQLSYP